MRHFNIPVFIPEEACPFQCIYCNQRKITGHLSMPSVDEVKNIIESHLSTIPQQNSHVQLAFFGGTFTGMSYDTQESFLKIVEPYIKKGKISSIRISTRPDYIDENILLLLKKYNVTNIELGAQSLDDKVLLACGRGHSYNDVAKASKLINNYGFTLGLQMMLGLPKDNLQKAINTAQKIIKLGAKETRIYPTLVIADTLLAEKFQEGNYTPLTTEEAIIQSAEIYKIFYKNSIKVLRIGLYPSEEFISNQVIAGPNNLHFKEKVMTYIWWSRLEKLMHCNDNSKCIEIAVAPKQLNFAIGFQGENRKQLLSIFHKVKFKTDKQIPEDSYNVNYC